MFNDGHEIHLYDIHDHHLYDIHLLQLIHPNHLRRLLHTTTTDHIEDHTEAVPLQRQPPSLVGV
jgi:hypothetical protein